ncbi:MAG: dihydrodipicolinate reductase, partial [Thaumarchaeota archaeon]|nr:dihydrodipicolinate reductase [Nitrososphaerota archaeon]
DINPQIIGEDVGEVVGLERIGVKVTANVEEALKSSEIVLHATSSYLPQVYPQLLEAVKLGKSVVSTCETLSYPFHRYPVLARKLDEAARTYGVSVIGTGINPGFLLDTLASVLAASVPTIKKIRARRSLDAAKRRSSFIKKIGVGLDPSEYGEKLKRGEYSGHVGYAESVYLIADAAGLNPSKVVEGQEPVIAEERVESGGIIVEAGKVSGIRGFGAGFVGDEERIRVEFEASVGAEEYEEIIVEGGDYSVKWRSSGTPGDLGTASIVLSVAERLEYAPYGLLTMSDLLPFRIGLR